MLLLGRPYGQAARCSFHERGAVMATQIEIGTGPSKFDLMLSLFEYKQVTFTIGSAETPKIKVVIQQIGVDTDCGDECWNLEGVVKREIFDQPPSWKERTKDVHFTAWFDSNKRRGTIRIDDVVVHCTDCGAEKDEVDLCQACQKICCECSANIAKSSKICPLCEKDPLN